MGATLRVELLGGFRVWVGGGRIPEAAWRRRKAAQLIKLLVLAPAHRMHREELLELLWPESSPAAARNNLHQTLHLARHILEPDLPPAEQSAYLCLEGDLVALCPEAALLVDVDAFMEAAQRARGADDPALFEEAVALYTGDLLPEDHYEDWAAARQEELRRVRHDLLRQLALLDEERGNRTGAIEALQRLVAVEPAEEGAHRELMRLYALEGDRYEALRQYERLRDDLRREVDTEPDPLTENLHQKIQSLQVETWAPTAADLVDATPDDASPDSSRQTNLPRHLTRFVGREGAVAHVRDLLRAHRLVTLTGTGGIGKSRLAMEAAGAVQGAYADGVWMVELAPMSDPRAVPQAIAGILGVREQPGPPITERLIDSLRLKELLLILDSCEHLLDPCAELANSLIERCPRVRLLVTSRKPLGLPSEAGWRVPTLAVPDVPDPRQLEPLSHCDAVALFLDRTHAVRPTFVLTSENASAVVEVCRRLDGIPLAIELAAARMRALTVEQLGERLGDCFAALDRGRSSALSQRATLRSTMDWSYQLLDEPERMLFRRLAVFVGGWTLEAAEGVCRGDGIEEREVLGLLAELVDQSLVVAAKQGAAMRYRMLEPVRQYAAEKLASGGDEEELRRRHAEWYLQLAEQAEPALSGSEQLSSRDRLEEDHDNLRAVLGWARDQGESEIGLRLAGALWRFWYQHGHVHEGRRWIEELLAAIGADRDGLPKPVLAGALFTAGALAYNEEDLLGAAPRLEESLVLFRELADRRGMARSLNALASVTPEDLDRAGARFEESLALYREIGDVRGEAVVLSNLGNLSSSCGDYGRAAELVEKSLALQRRLGDRWGMANALSNLGDFSLYLGDLKRAAELQSQALALRREIGDALGIPECLGRMGDAALEMGDREGARVLYREALEGFRDVGLRWGAACCVEGLAVVIAGHGDAKRAAQLLSVADATISAGDSPPGHQARSARRTAALRNLLDESTFDAAWKLGRTMTLEQAVDDALHLSQGHIPTDLTRSTLTRRERDVAGLVAQGRTNHEIAEELGMSEQTAAAHVHHLLRKLDVASRKEIAARVDEQGVVFSRPPTEAR